MLSLLMSITPAIEPDIVAVIGLYSSCYSHGANSNLLLSALQYLVSILCDANLVTSIVFKNSANAFQHFARVCWRYDKGISLVFKGNAKQLVGYAHEISNKFYHILTANALP